MAISHIQPLLLLLASLFFLPALHAVNFRYCNESGYDFGEVTMVHVFPSVIEPETQSINMILYGSPRERTSKGVIDVFERTDRILKIKRFDLCSLGSICPIQAGSNFILDLFDIPTKDDEFSKFPKAWRTYVIIFSDEGVGHWEEPAQRMCIQVDLMGSTATLVYA